ncbi:carboxypeptidase regulatory-like domain-containing protein [soil metagenome]
MLGILALCALLWPADGLMAQVTTGSLTGSVVDQSQRPLGGAAITAVHRASGTRYSAITRTDGRYDIPGMRVGGPYTVSLSHIGYTAQDTDDVYVSLGSTTRVDFVAREAAVALAGIDVAAERRAIISPERTGAATSISREALATVPTISGRLTDIVRLTPQSSGSGFSFGGADPRLNNVTVDGSYFNNSFGLRNAPGETSGVAPISLAAIEEVQVNIAPYDVRQGNFVGAGVNTVTRSGTNELRGAVAYSYRDDGLVGRKSIDRRYAPGTFAFNNVGGWLSGPLVKNRLFFFVNFEDEALTEPGTTFRANTGSQEVKDNILRTRASDLDELSAFLRSNFEYETGPYEGYDHEIPARRFLGKLDLNVNERNKISLRYNHLDSSTDILLSNSNSLGAGSRRQPGGGTGMNFRNSNYMILENIRSFIGELNSVLGPRTSNQLIAGYTTQDESRDSPGRVFPFVDILESGSVYTSFGFEPFTLNNELRYNTLQVQNNLTVFRNRHTFTVGASVQRYRSDNVFFRGSQSIYVYNSLADFYTDANDHLANPNRTTSPVTLNRFQVGYMNLPGLDKPLQPLDVLYTGVYAQDEWRLLDNVRITAGLRVDAPFFKETGFANPNADAVTFRDEKGNPVQYKSGELPGTKAHWSPRVGFNWDVLSDRTTQIRGGTGVFTGPPAYVWISNQVGNTGMLTGEQSLTNTRDRPFHPDPNRHKPTSVDGTPARSYALAVTDPDFKFPQVWRTNLGVDRQLPLGLIGTADFIYSRDVNGIYYINANLPAAQSAFSGPDTRPRWTGTSCNNPTAGPCVNRINNAAGNQISNAVVMKNQNVGSGHNVAFSLERPFNNGVFVKGAYSYGILKNTVDPGSIASGTWQNNPHNADANNPGTGISVNSPGHRVFLTGSYRREWFSFGATTISLFWQTRNIGNTSYVYGSDLNGDGGTNDLLYIPKDQSEMFFVPIPQTASNRAFTVAEQEQAMETFIAQDKYLSSRRGQYAERGAVWLPRVTRADLSVSQELFRNVRGARNAVRVRADVVNVGNMLNKDWGVSQRIPTGAGVVAGYGLLTNTGFNAATGTPTYRMRISGGELLTQTWQKTLDRQDVWELQMRVEYSFR